VSTDTADIHGKKQVPLISFEGCSADIALPKRAKYLAGVGREVAGVWRKGRWGRKPSEEKFRRDDARMYEVAVTAPTTQRTSLTFRILKRAVLKI
jgi:hypothetical protein